MVYLYTSEAVLPLPGQLAMAGDLLYCFNQNAVSSGQWTGYCTIKHCPIHKKYLNMRNYPVQKACNAEIEKLWTR